MKKTHGHSAGPAKSRRVSAAYNSWSHMKQRCGNPRNVDYHNYGGRGISVCAKWLTFAGFWEDMAESWAPGLTLDRKDNNLGYFKENCRWATAKQQARNTRKSCLTFEQAAEVRQLYAEGKSICDLCRKFGVHEGPVYDIVRRGR